MTLEEQNQELNDAANARLSQLRTIIEAHEQALKEMGVFRDVWYCYDSEPLDYRDPNEYRSYAYLIGMIKWRGEWRLCHDVQIDCEDETDWKPLADAAIALRMKAIQYIGNLRETIVEDKKKLNPLLDECIEKAAKLLKNPEPVAPKKKRK